MNFPFTLKIYTRIQGKQTMCLWCMFECYFIRMKWLKEVFHQGKYNWNAVLLLSGLLYLSCCGIVLAASATGKEAKMEKKPDPVEVAIIAPSTAKKLLEKYITLPPKPFKDEIDLAAYARKIRQESVELLATEGYFTPEVEFDKKKGNGKAKAYELRVKPGPRTRVAAVAIEFQGALATDEPVYRARVEQLRAEWPLKPGKIFRSARWEDAKSALLSSVASRDFATARIVESQAKVDPDTAQATLSIIIDSGPAYRYGELQITGLERYRPDVIQNSAPFRPGDPYRRDQLLAFQVALQNGKLFNAAAVTIKPDPALHEAVPVIVTLTEAKSKQFGAGIGYSSNNGARGEINYRDYNFLGRAWNLSSLLRLEQKRQTFSTRIDTLPDANRYRYSSGVRVEMTDIKNLKTFNQRVDFSRIRTTTHSILQVGVNWQREEREPSGAPKTVNETLALDSWYRYHDIDDPVNVRRGFISEARLGGGSSYALSDRSFIRSYLRHQHWLPIGRRDTLYFRAEAGYTLASSRQGIPQEYLFRAGGIQSIRGYDFLSLGVREGNAIVGGRVLATGTAEYVHWFTNDWGGAVFTDIGDAADKWKEFDLAVGYGVGARWRSPAGPFALDLARRHDTGTLRVHFSIAVAF
ncbi:autotransporter assembly complex family protein [Nitrosomonas sp. HPC101]|uniref:autotransporter assembly complex protein TamA n=1 Tax=Nitrosomonas sp. HPC101 TaxID=1658667 RepID=UPI001F033E8C|nr:autotransporter assembly complex family protein [Nitrosomonas sp. HPC101]